MGNRKKDLIKFIEDMKKIFHDERFSDYRNMLLKDHNADCRMTRIKENKLNEILLNSSFNEDDKLLITILSNTINSEKKCEVTYVSRNDLISSLTLSHCPLHPDLLNVLRDPRYSIYQGSQTAPTNQGSYSFIVDEDTSGNDYFNEQNERVAKPAGREIISIHEVIGHGRSLSIGRGHNNQHKDAILLENLALRVMGHTSIQRDGTDHLSREKIDNYRTKKVDFQ